MIKNIHCNVCLLPLKRLKVAEGQLKYRVFVSEITNKFAEMFYKVKRREVMREARLF